MNQRHVKVVLKAAVTRKSTAYFFVTHDPKIFYSNIANRVLWHCAINLVKHFSYKRTHEMKLLYYRNNKTKSAPREEGYRREARNFHNLRRVS